VASSVNHLGAVSKFEPAGWRQPRPKLRCPGAGVSVDPVTGRSGTHQHDVRTCSAAGRRFCPITAAGTSGRGQHRLKPFLPFRWWILLGFVRVWLRHTAGPAAWVGENPLRCQPLRGNDGSEPDGQTVMARTAAPQPRLKRTGSGRPKGSPAQTPPNAASRSHTPSGPIRVPSPASGQIRPRQTLQQGQPPRGI